MKKKIVLTIGITVVLLTGVLLGTTIIYPNQKNSGFDLQTYIYEPVSIVDNKIDMGDTYALPFIFETADDRLSESYIQAEFAKANLTIQNISSKRIGTGTKIQTQEDTKPYVVLIYGDVNGDGKVGPADSQAIIESYLYPDVPEKQFTGIYYTAANVRNNDSKINLVDAQRITDFYLENITTLLSNPPTNDIINGIKVIAPNQLVYDFGEELDLTGSQIRRVTVSGVECIPETLTMKNISGYDSTKPGMQAITVNYAGFTTKFTVKVLEPITTLSIDESIKTESANVKQELILGVLKQGEGQSSLDKEKLKTKITFEVTTDNTVNSSDLTVNYKLRSEVFSDYTDENKNDIIVVATAQKPAKYQVTSYLGNDFETAVKSNETTIEVTKNIVIQEIEIDENLPIICKGNLDGVTLPSDRIYTEKKTVQGKEETIYYVLMKVQFKDQYGDYQSLKVSDFAAYEESATNKLTVKDNYGFSIPGLEIKLFRKDSNGTIVEAGGENNFDYIGFAPVHNANANRLNNGVITLTYGPANLANAVQANLKVNVIE